MTTSSTDSNKLIKKLVGAQAIFLLAAADAASGSSAEVRNLT
jgi:hypothetical protein